MREFGNEAHSRTFYSQDDSALLFPLVPRLVFTKPLSSVMVTRRITSERVCLSELNLFLLQESPFHPSKSQATRVESHSLQSESRALHRTNPMPQA